MLKINNQEYKIISATVKFIDSTYNTKKGYSVLIHMSIELNGVNGYINMWTDFFETKDFSNIENKKYKELPTELNSKIDIIEIYDIKNFVDFIDSDVILEFGKIINNKIETKIIIDDELIKLEYEGLIDI